MAFSGFNFILAELTCRVENAGRKSLEGTVSMKLVRSFGYVFIFNFF